MSQDAMILIPSLTANVIALCALVLCVKIRKLVWAFIAEQREMFKTMERIRENHRLREERLLAAERAAGAKH